MRIYIAGPMSGYPDHNFPAFNDLAKKLRDAGHMVFNPAENCGGDTTLGRAQYMRHDLPMVLQAEALALLPLWETSEGARLEARIALALGLDFFDGQGMIMERAEVKAAVFETLPRNPMKEVTV